MQTCKILTTDDKILIPDYLRIFNKVLSEISHFYDDAIIQQARARYTEDYVLNQLSSHDRKFAAHFANQTLDGVLIEGFDDPTLNRTSIYWVMAEQKRKGIGTDLIKDSIMRAKNEDKNMVTLVVSRKNNEARNLYERLGFKSGGTYENGTMEVMGYLIK